MNLSHSPIQARDLLEQAWEAFKKYVIQVEAAFFASFMIPMVLQVGIQIGFMIMVFIFFPGTQPSAGFEILFILLSVPMGLLSFVVQMIGQFTLFKACLMASRNQSMQVSDVKPLLPLLWPLIVSALLTALVCIPAFLLLILPGFYVLARLKFAGFFIIDGQTKSGIEALKKSWEMTEGRFGELCWIMGLQFGVVIAGFMAFFVGLWIAVPVCILMDACYYARLAPQKPVMLTS